MCQWMSIKWSTFLYGLAIVGILFCPLSGTRNVRISEAPNWRASETLTGVTQLKIGDVCRFIYMFNYNLPYWYGYLLSSSLQIGSLSWCEPAVMCAHAPCVRQRYDLGPTPLCGLGGERLGRSVAISINCPPSRESPQLKSHPKKWMEYF